MFQKDTKTKQKVMEMEAVLKHAQWLLAKEQMQSGQFTESSIPAPAPTVVIGDVSELKTAM